VINKIYLIPAEGHRVRDPAGPGKTLLPEEGKLVPESTYWLRRLKEKSVKKGKAPKAEKTETTEKPMTTRRSKKL